MFSTAHHIKRVAIVGLAWVALTAASTGEQVADLIEAGKPIEAFALAQEKAGEGDPEGQFALGWFYDNGENITADKAKAAGLYRKCADKGLSQCQWRLGVMYDTGEGVTEDPKAAFGWLKKAAAQDNLAAQVSLAVMHANGRGTPVDFAKAMDYYQAAARKREPHAFYGIGILYLEGQGVAADKETAAAWFSVAAALGDESGRAITDQMLADQKTEVLDRVAAKATALYSDYVEPVRPLPTQPAEAPTEASKGP